LLAVELAAGVQPREDQLDAGDAVLGMQSTGMPRPSSVTSMTVRRAA
jgi:hypothetical protein